MLSGKSSRCRAKQANWRAIGFRGASTDKFTQALVLKRPEHERRDTRYLIRRPLVNLAVVLGEVPQVVALVHGDHHPDRVPVDLEAVEEGLLPAEPRETARRPVGENKNPGILYVANETLKLLKLLDFEHDSRSRHTK